jgi:hypothetical protein
MMRVGLKCDEPSLFLPKSRQLAAQRRLSNFKAVRSTGDAACLSNADKRAQEDEVVKDAHTVSE